MLAASPNENTPPPPSQMGACAKNFRTSCTTHSICDDKMASLDEDAVDEILYLARANESADLASYLSELSAQTKRTSTDLVAAAIDPYSKNGALHYAAANGHNGMGSSRGAVYSVNLTA